MKEEIKVKYFYDTYWPKHIPDYEKTREHIKQLIPEICFNLSLDAGCGSGVCSLALADETNRVVAIDLSLESLKTALGIKEKLSKKKFGFC